MFRTVRFHSAQVIEWGFDKDGEPVTPGGKDVTSEIVKALVGGGAQVSEVEQHEDYGWAFTTHVESESFHHVLNAFDNDVYLTISTRAPRPACDRYSELIDRTLRAMPGASEVVWEGYTT